MIYDDVIVIIRLKTPLMPVPLQWWFQNVTETQMIWHIGQYSPLTFGSCHPDRHIGKYWDTWEASKWWHDIWHSHWSLFHWSLFVLAVYVLYCWKVLNSNDITKTLSSTSCPLHVVLACLIEQDGREWLMSVLSLKSLFKHVIDLSFIDFYIASGKP